MGTKSNPAGIGARVTVTTSTMTQIDEVRAGGSYTSTNDCRLHFGLGSDKVRKDKVMKKVEIQWPRGLNPEFHDLPENTLYEMKEVETPRIMSALPVKEPDFIYASGESA